MSVFEYERRERMTQERKRNIVLRFARELRRRWKGILLGAASGVYVAVALAFVFLIYVDSTYETFDEATLALVLDGLLLVSVALGALVGARR